MRDFLDEYITTLSSRRAERVQNLLAAAKVDKNDLNRIANKLSDLTNDSPMVISPEQHNGIIESEKFGGTYQDLMQKLGELFGSSNMISLLLDSHSGVLTSEIKALEDDISAMTKSIENYAFTLSDGGFYNYSFMETFNDETMRFEIDPSNLSDRSGLNFRSDEGAFVNRSSGALTLTPSLQVSHHLNGSILNSNCGSYVTSDTGIENALNSSVNSGWRISVSSPRPISSALNEFTRQGAQFQLEFELESAIPSDSLVFVPLADKTFEILKLTVYYSNEENELQSFDLVSSPQLVDKPIDFSFSLRPITKFVVWVNQPIYQRSGTPSLVSEETHRKVYSAIKERQAEYKDDHRLSLMGSYRFNSKALHRTIGSTFNKTLPTNQTRIFRAQSPQINFDVVRGPMSVSTFIKREDINYGKSQIWAKETDINQIFRRMIHQNILASAPNSIGRRFLVGTGRLFGDVVGNQLDNPLTLSGLLPQPIETYIDSSLTVDGNFFTNELLNGMMTYDYDLGFRNVQIGRGQKIFRGIYVTKPLPADSDSGEVKIKVDDVNYEIGNTGKDSSVITSIEYSISNKSTPEKESDWIPIVPTNFSSEIKAERLFINEAGIANFRFEANRQENLVVYKNRLIVDNALLTFIESNDSQAFSGVRFPLNFVGPNDIFVVDYHTFGDKTIINFTKEGEERTSLASAFDQNGAGQTFFSTVNGRIITLNHEPYVDYNQVNKFGSYSTDFGFKGAYQPITIVMSDGTVAFNQTNYLGKVQNSLLDFDDSKVAYIHTGKNITFNKVLDESFTVFYQYLPSNLKARVVLRVNDSDYISPRVNSIQIKTKTRKANARREI